MFNNRNHVSFSKGVHIIVNNWSVHNKDSGCYGHTAWNSLALYIKDVLDLPHPIIMYPPFSNPCIHDIALLYNMGTPHFLLNKLSNYEEGRTLRKPLFYRWLRAICSITMEAIPLYGVLMPPLLMMMPLWITIMTYM